MTLQRINPESLGIKVTIDATEWIVFYNQTNGKLERFLLGDNIEIINNKATDFSVINDIKYPTTKAVNDQKGIANGLASLDANGLLDPTQIPPIAITKVVVAVETTISAFAANSGNYTFEQGDVILIDDNGNIEHYLFKGGDKTDVNEYSLINATEITISQVIGLQSALDGKAGLADNQIFTGNNSFSNPTTLLNTLVFNAGTTNYQIYNVGDDLWVRDNTNGVLIFRFSPTEIVSTNNITAPFFIGDGSLLTGINNKQVYNTQTTQYVSSGSGAAETYYSYSIPANTLNIGDIMEIRYTGRITNTSGANNVSIGYTGASFVQSFFNNSVTSFDGLLRVVVISQTSARFIFISNDYTNFTGANNERRRLTGISSSGFDISNIVLITGNAVTSNVGGIEIDVVSVEIKRN